MHPQRRLEGVNVIYLDADHRDGPLDPRFRKSVADASVGVDVGDTPGGQLSVEHRAGGVIEHDDVGVTETELFDDP